MTIDDKIRDETLQYDTNRKPAIISSLSSGKFDKYEYLTGELLPPDKRRLIEPAKFTSKWQQHDSNPQPLNHFG